MSKKKELSFIDRAAIAAMGGLVSADRHADTKYIANRAYGIAEVMQERRDKGETLPYE